MKSATNSVIIILLLFLVGTLSACSLSDDRKSVNLALKKDGKTYVFSMIGAVITKHHLSNGDTPSIMSPIGIVELDGELYLQAGEIEDFVNMISGNYELLPYQEQSYDGYIVEGEFKVYTKKIWG